jgi:hypothetical protein
MYDVPTFMVEYRFDVPTFVLAEYGYDVPTSFWLNTGTEYVLTSF